MLVGEFYFFCSQINHSRITLIIFLIYDLNSNKYPVDVVGTKNSPTVHQQCDIYDYFRMEEQREM